MSDGAGRGRKHPATKPAGRAPTAFLLYESDDGQTRVEVRLAGETVWLSLLQLSQLFGRDKSVISRHLKNLFDEGELGRDSVVANHATTAADGKVYQVEHFNLDVIISVGYRVRSQRGVQFRIWATHRLREYQQVSTEYKQLPALHERLWAFFAGVKNRQDLEQYRQLLVPKFTTDREGQSFDERRKLRDDFYEALTRFGLCLQTALSSRGFFEDRSFPETLIRTYKDDLRFFTSLRKIVREDALETVDYSVYEEQLRRLVDRQVIGQEVREPAGVYLVHELGKAVDPATWAEDKTRNETDLIRTRLRKTIKQVLAEDPYAQKVFAELLKMAIAKAEALFDHPIKQYALFKAFEKQVRERATPGVPDKLANNAHAKAFFGAIRLSLGEVGYLALDTAAQAGYADLALEIDRVVRTAVAEYSLNLQDIESAIRKNLLPRLFSVMGLDKARAVIEQVVQIVRVGLSKT